MDEARSQQLRWRVVVLAGVILTIAFGAVGLRQYQSHEITRCAIQGEGGITQEFEFAVGDASVGEGCRYAVEAARGVQHARWWWFGAASVLALTFATLPLATLRSDDGWDDDDLDDEPE